MDAPPEPIVRAFGAQGEPPYWRPKEYTTAIVLVDAIAWHEADEELLELLPSRDQGTQLLIRGAIFRLLSDGNPTADRYHVLVRGLRSRS